MREQQWGAAPVRLVFLAAHDDRSWCRHLDRHLYPLRQKGLLSTWSSLDIAPGTEWRTEMEIQCATASLLVLLLSVSFFDDPLCFSLMEQALTRPSVQIIPVLLHPVLWTMTPLAHLRVLPADGRAIAHRNQRESAFFEIAREIAWRITGEPLTTMQQPHAASSSQNKNRQALLKKLHQRYAQVLEKALHGNALFPITFQSQPALLNSPMNTLFRHLPQHSFIFPERTSLVDIYDQSGGELLMLGEAGSGKSTLLVHLAQGLLIRADRDNQQLIPIIFHLASWTEKRLPLADWLVEQLYLLHYDISPTLRRQWIEQGQILPLLDGLDEVPLADRAACIEAINAYRRDYLVPLVVCGRTTEYFEQSARLVLQHAVLLQPLTPNHVTDALNRTPADFTTLRMALQQNTALQELARSPFFLNVMMVAYRGIPASDFLQNDPSPVEQEQQLFARYLHRALSTPTPGQRQPATGLLSHLIWLAQQMRAQSQAIFYLERLPASWLNNQRMQRWYALLAIHLPAILIGSLIGFAVDNVLFQVVPLVDALLLGAALGDIASAEDRSHSTTYSLSLRLKHSFVWSGIGFCAGVLSEFLQKWSSGKLSSITFAATLLYGLVYAMTLWFWSAFHQKQKTTLPRPRSLFRQGIRAAFRIGLPVALSFGLAFGLYKGLTAEVPSDSTQGLEYGISWFITAGASTFFIFTIVGGILHLFTPARLQGQLADRRRWSWQRFGIGVLSLRSLRRVLFFTGLLAVGFGLYIGISSGILNTFSGSGVVLLAVVLYGISAMLTFGLAALLSVVLTYQILFAIAQSMESETIDDQDRIQPNEGIHHSIRNALFSGGVGLIVAGFTGLVLGLLQNTVLGMATANAVLRTLSFWLPSGSTESLQGVTVVSIPLLSLGLGLSMGVLLFFFNGGLAFWQHYTLRFLFWIMGIMPRNEVRLLEDGARHILLYRAGGGYMFIHRLFLNYIADLRTTQTIACSCGYISDRPHTRFCPQCGSQLGR